MLCVVVAFTHDHSTEPTSNLPGLTDIACNRRSSDTCLSDPALTLRIGIDDGVVSSGFRVRVHARAQSAYPVRKMLANLQFNRHVVPFTCATSGSGTWRVRTLTGNMFIHFAVEACSTRARCLYVFNTVHGI